MQTKNQLDSNVAVIIASAEQADTPAAKVFILWSGVIKPVFGLLKDFISPKNEKEIEIFEQAANSLNSYTEDGLANYCLYWEALRMKVLLKMLKVFTGPKVDEVIDKFIHLSESLCNVQQSQTTSNLKA